MARALSQDLRQRIVSAALKSSLSKNKAAVRFAVSSPTLWVREFETLGSLDHGVVDGHKPATCWALIATGAWIAAKAAATLANRPAPDIARRREQ